MYLCGSEHHLLQIDEDLSIREVSDILVVPEGTQKDDTAVIWCCETGRRPTYFPRGELSLAMWSVFVTDLTVA